MTVYKIKASNGWEIRQRWPEWNESCKSSNRGLRYCYERNTKLPYRVDRRSAVGPPERTSPASIGRRRWSTAIADSLAKILCLSGFPAIAAYDGNSALETALLKPPELLITDVVLPGMNGVELAITVKRVFPDCKILLFSGQASTGDLLATAHRDGHRFTLLNKPVPPQELLTMVAENLNGIRVGHPATVA